jgi:hypothetical protein
LAAKSIPFLPLNLKALLKLKSGSPVLTRGKREPMTFLMNISPFRASLLRQDLFCRRTLLRESKKR